MQAGRIYLDNCVTTCPAPEVLTEMQPYWEKKVLVSGNFYQHG